MNNRELIGQLSSKMNLPKSVVSLLLDSFVQCVKEQLKDDNVVGIQSFGTFDLKKREERVFVNPQTQLRTLIPPKLVVSFKQSQILKEKLNI